MRRVGGFGLSLLLLVSVTACKVHTPSLGDDGPERSCTPPKLTIVGHAHGHGPVIVHPGQTLRLRGRDFTDDCAAGGAGTGVPISKDQLVLMSTYGAGALATVHPRGAHSAFVASVTIPATTVSGPARLIDSAGLAKVGIRLVVRR